MKILLVVPRYIKPTNKRMLDKIGPFNKLLKNAGIRYDVCWLCKKSILNSITNGCQFILLLDMPSIDNAGDFFETGYSMNGVISTMLDELTEIGKNIPMYPPISLIKFIMSEKYITKLPHASNIFAPYIKCFLYYKTTIVDKLNEVCSYFVNKQVDKISVKMGYDTTVHVYPTNYLIDLVTKHAIIHMLDKYRMVCGFAFLIWIEPYNPIVHDKMNEYKCLFINGILSPIATFNVSDIYEFSPIVHPSIELDPIRNMEHANIITVAKYTQSVIQKYINMIPITLHVNVSWMILPDGTKRYYVTNISLSNTIFKVLYQPSDASSVNRIYNVNQCTPTLCQSYPEDIQKRLIMSYIEYITTKI